MKVILNYKSGKVCRICRVIFYDVIKSFIWHSKYSRKLLQPQSRNKLDVGVKSLIWDTRIIKEKRKARYKCSNVYSSPVTVSRTVTA